MTEQIKVRGYLAVTITVPLEFTVELDELDEWMTEGGGSPWDGSADDVAEFIRAGDPTEWMAPWPAADPNNPDHSVDSAELVEVEVLGQGEATR
ncbi:hypothetical protein BH09ACT9_BH09ACT9_00310 [soil metagenome]